MLLALPAILCLLRIALQLFHLSCYLHCSVTYKSCCVSAGVGTCTYKENMYGNGATFRDGRCKYCSCINGKTICSTAVCPSTTCKPYEKLVSVPGGCCERCQGNVECVLYIPTYIAVVNFALPLWQLRLHQAPGRTLWVHFSTCELGTLCYVYNSTWSRSEYWRIFTSIQTEAKPRFV